MLKFLLIKILHRFKSLKYFNLHCRTKLNEETFFIPIIHGIGYSNLFMSEAWMISLLKNVIGFKNQTFIDVGANIGQTLLKVKSVFKHINYVAFEPNPSCIFYLENLIQKNRFTNVQLYPIGISTQSGIYKLYQFSDSYVDPSASMVESFRPEEKIERIINIPAFNFDCLDLKIDNISILKIDIEGGELEVIKSALNIRNTARL